MVDDDLDLELDAEDEQEPPRRRRPPAAKPAQAQDAKAAEKPADKPAEKPAASVPVVPAERRSFLARILAPVTDFFSRIKLPAWNVRNFLIGLLALVLLVIVVENWPAMRLNFLGLHVDIPKAVVLILVFALGFALAWTMCRRRSETADDEGAPQP